MDASRPPERHLDFGGREDALVVGMLRCDWLHILLLIISLKINVPAHVKLWRLPKC